MRPHELGYYVGGLVQGSVEARLYEGESIIDRHGKVVATVIHGELVHMDAGDDLEVFVMTPDDLEVFVMTPEIFQELRKERFTG